MELRLLRAAICFSVLICMTSCSKEGNKRKFFDQGKVLFEKGDFKTAEIALRKAVKADVRYGEAHLLLGRVQLRLGKIAPAVQSFRRAALLMPELAEVRVALGDIFLLAYATDANRSKEILA